MKIHSITPSALAVLVSAMALSGTASAQMVVFDPANLAVNSVNSAANIANGITNGISAGANITTAVESILTRKAIENLDLNSDEHFEITQEFQNDNRTFWEDNREFFEDNRTFWEDNRKHFKHVVTNNETNNYYDGNIVLPPEIVDPIDPPIPTMGLAAHQEQFQSMEHYAEGTDLVTAAFQIDTTAALRASNASVLETVNRQAESLNKGTQRLGMLAEGLQDEKVLKSRNAQLQYANAIGVENTRQLMEMRELMLHSENASNARAQLDADAQARQFANGERLRQGSDKGELTAASRNW